MTVLQSSVRNCYTGYVLAVKGLYMSSTNIFYSDFSCTRPLAVASLEF